jgi:thiamine monophosphate kinase
LPLGRHEKWLSDWIQKGIYNVVNLLLFQLLAIIFNWQIKLYEEKIPIDPQTYQTSMDFNINPTVSALNGGEDYELLFTINQKDYEKIKNDPNLTVIGHITKKSQGINLIGNGDTSTPLQAQGWNHFNN